MSHHLIISLLVKISRLSKEFDFCELCEKKKTYCTCTDENRVKNWLSYVDENGREIK